MRQPIRRASRDESSTFIRAPRPASPYAHPLRRREVDLLARLDAECRVPRVEVAYRVGPILRRRMAVDDDPLPQRRLADLLPPALTEAEEEQLLGGEACGCRRRLVLLREPPGVVGDREPGDIGDVLTQCLPAVDVDVGQRPVGVELGDQPIAGGPEMREVARGPPVQEPPVGVEERTLVVEADGRLLNWWTPRSEEHTSELQSQFHLVCRLLLEKKKKNKKK